MFWKRFSDQIIIPFWERLTPRYPLYQHGDPQLRVFLPTFWMAMDRPPKDMPPGHLKFVIHPQMTKIDVKNYLDKIYNVKVRDVRLHTHRTERLHTNPQGNKIRMPVHPEEYRFAYVQLAKGEVFEYPDIFTKQVDPDDAEAKEEEKVAESLTYVGRKRKKELQNISQYQPEWFR